MQWQINITSKNLHKTSHALSPLKRNRTKTTIYDQNIHHPKTDINKNPTPNWRITNNEIKMPQNTPIPEHNPPSQFTNSMSMNWNLSPRQEVNKNPIQFIFQWTMEFMFSLYCHLNINKSNTNHTQICFFNNVYEWLYQSISPYHNYSQSVSQSFFIHEYEYPMLPSVPEIRCILSGTSIISYDTPSENKHLDSDECLSIRSNSNNNNKIMIIEKKRISDFPFHPDWTPMSMQLAEMSPEWKYRWNTDESISENPTVIFGPNLPNYYFINKQYLIRLFDTLFVSFFSLSISFSKAKKKKRCTSGGVAPIQVEKWHAESVQHWFAVDKLAAKDTQLARFLLKGQGERYRAVYAVRVYKPFQYVNAWIE